MRRRRPPRNDEDVLRDVKFNPSEFEGMVDPDVYLEWIQTFERFFDIKAYSDKKAFNIDILKLKKYASLQYKNTKR